MFETSSSCWSIGCSLELFGNRLGRMTQFLDASGFSVSGERINIRLKRSSPVLYQHLKLLAIFFHPWVRRAI